MRMERWAFHSQDLEFMTVNRWDRGGMLQGITGQSRNPPNLVPMPLPVLELLGESNPNWFMLRK